MVELHYRLVYVELVATPNGESWAIRSIVLIHKSWLEVKRNMFIIFYAREDGLAQSDIERQILDSQDRMTNWCAVHLMIFSCHLQGWRQYIRHLGVRLDKAVCFLTALFMDS